MLAELERRVAVSGTGASAARLLAVKRVLGAGQLSGPHDDLRISTDACRAGAGRMAAGRGETAAVSART